MPVWVTMNDGRGTVYTYQNGDSVGVLNHPAGNVFVVKNAGSELLAVFRAEGVMRAEKEQPDRK